MWRILSSELLVVRRFDNFVRAYGGPGAVVDNRLRGLLQHHLSGFIGIIDEPVAGLKSRLVEPFISGYEFGMAGGRIYKV